MEGRDQLVQAATSFYMEGRTKEALQQLTEGLGTLGLLDLMKINPSIFKEVFTSSERPLKATDLISLFKATLSHPESNQWRKEKRVEGYWRDFLLDIEEDEKDEPNTKKTTRWAVKTLRDFLAEKQKDLNFESYSATALNDTLREFYAAVKSTKEGGEYTVASLRSLRAVINRHLSEVNIITDTSFKTSNAVFKALLKCYRKSGKDTSLHHPRIPESDPELIRYSPALSPDTPVGLVRKVWFDLQLCLARRGREGNRELTMTPFSIQRDEDGVEYVSLMHNLHTKNHQDPNEPHKENLRGFMFAWPGDALCPVKSFKKYISKCPPDAKSFYLHPKCAVTETSDVWYSREPMGTSETC
ncbi:hypothetical protein ABVT39_009065 [Epinephelus coioides]